MDEIIFIGEGPSPSEIHSVYGAGLPVPVFGQRYPYELAEAYKSSGFTMGGVVATSCVQRVEASFYDHARSLVERGRVLLGPIVGAEGQIVPGIAAWIERRHS